MAGRPRPDRKRHVEACAHVEARAADIREVPAPAGTERAIVERLNAELRAALLSDDVRARIADEGGDPLVGTPEQQAADIGVEESKWGALVRKLGLREE